MPAIKDETNNKYGKLKVIEKIEDARKGCFWICECDCGNKTTVQGNVLRSGRTISCGKCSKNTWIIEGELVIGVTRNGVKFYIDKDDYKKVSKHTWHLSCGNYIANSQSTLLHRFIMNIDKKEVLIDHKDNNPLNNCKCNLREANKSENAINVKNVNGYSYDSKSYRVSIRVYGKNTYIGRFSTKEEAKQAYIDARNKYYNDFLSR
jgi:hypothetical protein